MRISFGEWTPDEPDLDSALSDVVNAAPYGKHYVQLRALARSGSPLPAAPVTAISTAPANGATETYAATATAIYKRDPATLAWTDVTGAAFSAETPMVWDMVQFGQYVLIASFNNPLRQRQIGGTGNFTAIANAPQARVLGVVRDFAIAGDINDPTDGVRNSRIRWSAISDPLTWPLAGTSQAYATQSDQQDLKTEFGAVRGIFGSDIGIVFQERAISRLSYVGTPLVFRIDTIDATRGLIGYNAGVQIGRVVFFCSEDGFFVTDGSGEATPIGIGKVNAFFFDDANPSMLGNVQAMVLPSQKCVAWAYASRSSNTLDRVLIYNFASGWWSRANYDVSYAMQARTSGFTLDQLDAFGTLETLGANFDSKTWQGGRAYPAVFDGAYYLCDFSGAPLTAVFETGCFGNEGRRNFINGVRPLIEMGSGTVTLGTQQYLGSTPVWGATRSITPATGKADFRSNSFFHRVRVTIAGGFDKAIGVDAITFDDAGAR